MRGPATYCFTCAKEIAHAHQVHRSQDGVACPGCVERVLESLPSLLPAERHAPAHQGEFEFESEPTFGSPYDPPEPA